MKYLLKLYIVDDTPNSLNALKNLKKLCEEKLKGKYELKIINILDNPQLAEDDRILATPTLTKILPPPMRSVIGDLSNIEKVLVGLDMVATEE